jgi:hypothetical protein
MHFPQDKQTLRRILEMQGVGLIHWKHLQPWAHAIVASVEMPPLWILDLSYLTFQGDIERCLREIVFAPPFEGFDEELCCDYAIACAFLRYRRRDLSWAGFLLTAGQLADTRDADGRSCAFYFELLNTLEDGGFRSSIERRQSREVSRHLAGPIAKAARDYHPFLQAFLDGVKSRRRVSRE